MVASLITSNPACRFIQSERGGYLLSCMPKSRLN